MTTVRAEVGLSASGIIEEYNTPLVGLYLPEILLNQILSVNLFLITSQNLSMCIPLLRVPPYDMR